MIGEGLGEWFEASSYGKKRLEMLRSAGQRPAKRVEGYSSEKIPAELLGFILFNDETTIGLNGEFRLSLFAKL